MKSFGTNIDTLKEIEDIMPILADVETQWDLYLASMYTLEELQKQNFENIMLPVNWFTEWLREIHA